MRKKQSFKDKLKDKQRKLAKQSRAAKEQYAKKKKRAEECKTRELLNDRIPPTPGPRVKKNHRAPNKYLVSQDGE